MGVPKPPGFSAPPLPIGHAPLSLAHPCTTRPLRGTPLSAPPLPAGHAPHRPLSSPRDTPLSSAPPLAVVFPPPTPPPSALGPSSFRASWAGRWGGGGGAIRPGSRTSFGNRPWRLARAGPGAWPPGSASGFALGGGLACLELQHQLKWPCDRGRRPPLFHFVSIHLGLAVWHPPLQATQFRLRVPDEIRSG